MLTRIRLMPPSHSSLVSTMMLGTLILLLAACATQKPTRVPVVVYDFPTGGTFKTPEPITPITTTTTQAGSAGNGSSSLPIYSWPKAQRLPDTPENRKLLAMDMGRSVKPTKADSPSATIAPPPPPTPPPSTDKSEANSPSSDAVENAGNVGFSWPAQGELLRSFGQGGVKGIEIGGKVGDPVFAAAEGSVTYTGVGLRGYGKLIVVKHPKNFLSVYAHNSKILVKEGDTVKRGQRIAELGDTEANKPKLLFQLRQGKNTLDPKKYLPPK